MNQSNFSTPSAHIFTADEVRENIHSLWSFLEIPSEERDAVIIDFNTDEWALDLCELMRVKAELIALTGAAHRQSVVKNQLANYGITFGGSKSTNIIMSAVMYRCNVSQR